MSFLSVKHLQTVKPYGQHQDVEYLPFKADMLKNFLLRASQGRQSPHLGLINPRPFCEDASRKMPSIPGSYTNGHSHETLNTPAWAEGDRLERGDGATTASPYTLTPIRAPWTSYPHGSMAAPSIQGHEETGAPLGKSVDDRPPAILSTLESGNSGRVLP